jgi:hypothetical protein
MFEKPDDALFHEDFQEYKNSSWKTALRIRKLAIAYMTLMVFVAAQ